MTRSEIFSVMTCGMATIVGTMIVIYVKILGPVIPDVLGHILTASIINATVVVFIAKFMVPERKNEIVSFGIKSTIAGTIASCMTGAIIGIIY